jgi:hypothetical protein
MAHFAQLDENSQVIQIIVVNNNDCGDLSFPESELVGVAFCHSLFGSDTKWVQTSYNNNFRRKYAGIGDTYDPSLDVFIARQPYPSWTLNAEGFWVSPMPKPEEPDNYVALWHEEDMRWYLIFGGSV